MTLIHNILAAFSSFLGATVWTRGLSHLVKTKRLRPHAARKVMHITTAPLFALTWPLYGPQPCAAYFAALVPFSFALRMLSNPQSDALIRAVASDRASSHIAFDKEKADSNVLQTESSAHFRHACGPVSYGLSVAAVTAISWRDNPETYVALATLCLGDGMADVIGSACKGPRWPLSIKLFKKRKTIPGTIAFIVSALLGSFGFMKFAAKTYVTPPISWQRMLTAVGSSAVVEILPIEDNITVPLTAFLVMRISRNNT